MSMNKLAERHKKQISCFKLINSLRLNYNPLNGSVTKTRTYSLERKLPKQWLMKQKDLRLMYYEQCSNLVTLKLRQFLCFLSYLSFSITETLYSLLPTPNFWGRWTAFSSGNSVSIWVNIIHKIVHVHTTHDVWLFLSSLLNRFTLNSESKYPTRLSHLSLKQVTPTTSHSSEHLCARTTTRWQLPAARWSHHV